MNDNPNPLTAEPVLTPGEVATMNADLKDAVNLIRVHPSDVLRSQPGRWGRLSEHHTRQAATVWASRVRNGFGAWLPRGSFETIARTEDGVHVVYARYVGEDGPR